MDVATTKKDKKRKRTGREEEEQEGESLASNSGIGFKLNPKFISRETKGVILSEVYGGFESGFWTSIGQEVKADDETPHSNILVVNAANLKNVCAVFPDTMKALFVILFNPDDPTDLETYLETMCHFLLVKALDEIKTTSFSQAVKDQVKHIKKMFSGALKEGVSKVAKITSALNIIKFLNTHSCTFDVDRFFQPKHKDLFASLCAALIAVPDQKQKQKQTNTATTTVVRYRDGNGNGNDDADCVDVHELLAKQVNKTQLLEEQNQLLERKLEDVQKRLKEAEKKVTMVDDAKNGHVTTSQINGMFTHFRIPVKREYHRRNTSASPSSPRTKRETPPVPKAMITLGTESDQFTTSGNNELKKDVFVHHNPMPVISVTTEVITTTTTANVSFSVDELKKQQQQQPASTEYASFVPQDDEFVDLTKGPDFLCLSQSTGSNFVAASLQHIFGADHHDHHTTTTTTTSSILNDLKENLHALAEASEGARNEAKKDKKEKEKEKEESKIVEIDESECADGMLMFAQSQPVSTPSNFMTLSQAYAQ